MTKPEHSDRIRTVRRIRVQVPDVGPDGLVGAGTLLEWAEAAARATADQWCGGSGVLASLDTFQLDRRIRVGENLELHADLVYTGRNSMHILVTTASGDRLNGQSLCCPMVFVGLDHRGRLLDVPSWTPQTMLDLQRRHQARVRAVMRKHVQATRTAQDWRDSPTPSATMRFRAGQTDVDRNGILRGGRALRWIDEVAFACVAAFTGTDVQVSHIAGIRCLATIVLDQVVDVTVRITHTGARSVHCSIQCTSADPYQTQLLADGLVVLVALDENEKTRPVPQIVNHRRGA